MPSTTFKLTFDWAATNRHTASADQDILLSNVGGSSVQFEITTDDAFPALGASQGHTVQPSRSFAMQLKAGERLWMAGGNAQATLLVG